MAIKKRSKEVSEEAEKLANEIADKPYGKASPESNNEEMTTTSFALPTSVLYALEDIAKNNKRAGIEPKNVSALIREAIVEKYIK